MDDIHKNYVQEFLKQGTTKMNQFGYEIEPNIINGPNGLTSINLKPKLGRNVKYNIGYVYPKGRNCPRTLI